MKNLILNSIFLFIFSGCSLSLFNTLQKSGEPTGQNSNVVSWFQEGHRHYLLNTSITLYRNRFSGIMIIRPFGDNHFRVVFITEMGLKVFDMEFTETGNIIMHYCMESLNRKAVMKTLQNDIGLMINWRGNAGKLTELKDKKSGAIVIKQKQKNKSVFYFLNESGKTERMLQTGMITKKVNLLFYKNNQNTLDSIKISHYYLKLNIHLTAINETKSSVSE